MDGPLSSTCHRDPIELLGAGPNLRLHSRLRELARRYSSPVVSAIPQCRTLRYFLSDWCRYSGQHRQWRERWDSDWPLLYCSYTHRRCRANLRRACWASGAIAYRGAPTWALGARIWATLGAEDRLGSESASLRQSALVAPTFVRFRALTAHFGVKLRPTLSGRSWATPPSAMSGCPIELTAKSLPSPRIVL